MFDNGLPGPESLADADDNLLVAAISGWATVEAAAAARRLAAIGELVARRTRGADAVNRSRWSCDYWDAAASEVAAAEQISHGMASSQMYLASALRDRLPKVAALFLDGTISSRLVATIAWRTTLITDPYLLHTIDTEIAEIATGLGPLSAAKTAAAIDALIDRYDPDAIRRQQRDARSREVVVDIRNGENGTAALWGRLFATDATALDRRLTQLAHTVCDDDPRTLAQRRADALGALAAGAEALACACGRPDCPAAGVTDARATNVLVHVVAEAAAVDAAPDPQLSGETELDSPDASPRPSATRRRAPSGRIIGGGSVPPGLLAELIAGGATVKPLLQPTGSAAQPRYRPSAALAAFVRARDMTCRFPGCDRPATQCDVDHAVAFPFGPTHPGNLRCLCRKHHLLKTFWTGATGWRDRQHPDGTIDWTSPTGHTYTTRPGSRLLFPSLCLPAIAPPATAPAPSSDRGREVMMPIRRHTRAQDRLSCIQTERAHNLAERDKPPP